MPTSTLFFVLVTMVASATYANEIPVHVDTLWMRRPADYGPLVAAFESVAFGGTPTVLLTLILERSPQPDGRDIAVHTIYMLDPLTGDTLAKAISR